MSARQFLRSLNGCARSPVKEAIAAGKLSLNSAATLERFFKDDGATLDNEQKLKVVAEAQGKTKDELEVYLYPDKAESTLTFFADRQTRNDLRRVGELLGITDLSALIKEMARFARKAKDPLLKRQTTKSFSEKLLSSPDNGFSEKLSPAPTGQPACRRDHIPADLRRAVWLRDDSRCSYVDSLTKRRCASRFALQIDHCIPLACGGTNTLHNLRLLCPGHNRLAAKRVFGRTKIERYFRRPRVSE